MYKETLVPWEQGGLPKKLTMASRGINKGNA